MNESTLNRPIRSFALALGLGTVIFAASACGEATRRFDCLDICNQYEQCIDSDLDTTSCVEQCESRGDADPDFEQAADDCETCLDGRACAESGPCLSTCAPVVAASI